MTEKNYDNLVIRWPELFEKSNSIEPEIGDGWFNILDTVCQVLSEDVVRLKNEQKYFRKLINQAHYLTEESRQFYEDRLVTIEETLEKALADLPMFTDISSQTGELIIDVLDCKDSHRQMINFAKLISSKTCEWCSSAGIMRYSLYRNQISTLCDKCYPSFEPNAGF